MASQLPRGFSGLLGQRLYYLWRWVQHVRQHAEPPPRKPDLPTLEASLKEANYAVGMVGVVMSADHNIH
ncbi:MAG: hypothetical protein KM310_11445, partial [Clostridiales bacterium]|nr:hypothetical protein [Clostridiales bacterium]